MPSQAHPNALLTDDRGYRGALLVRVGEVPACRTINAIDLRTLDRHHEAVGRV